MKYVSINEDQIITGVSDHPFHAAIKLNVNVPSHLLLGKRIKRRNPRPRIALICNWDQQCGISTYTKYLVEQLLQKPIDLRLFSEHGGGPNAYVQYCWTRGESLTSMTKAVLKWNPDFVLIQHEFGLFPKASHFLKLLEMLNHVPYAVVLHSVYDSHLDKTCCTSAIKNIIVHTDQARSALIRLGHPANRLSVIPHGCVLQEEKEELWNIFQTPTIVQFGFGFFYKGVDRAIDALAILKNKDKKYEDLFYCYLCSENDKSSHIFNEYYSFLCNKIHTHGLENNVAILRGYHEEQVLGNYIRTAKIALFPYVTDPKNVVYGSSGAALLAMSYLRPVIASESHLFDNVEGVLPRPASAEALADEIDRILSSEAYRSSLAKKAESYLLSNTWATTADRYLAIAEKIISHQNCVEVP